jgi:hypothetical protein
MTVLGSAKTLEGSLDGSRRLVQWTGFKISHSRASVCRDQADGAVGNAPTWAIGSSPDLEEDRRSFEECDFEDTLVKCPECGQRHALTCEEAVFVEDEDAGSDPSPANPAG